MSDGDSPPPTPEMLLIEPVLNRLVAPVVTILRDAGVHEMRASFVALWAVKSVLANLAGESLSAEFIVKHQSHPSIPARLV